MNDELASKARGTSKPRYGREHSAAPKKGKRQAERINQTQANARRRDAERAKASGAKEREAPPGPHEKREKIDEKGKTRTRDQRYINKSRRRGEGVPAYEWQQGKKRSSH